ncbi:hypothetical protein GCM10010289_73220 [Streptomyces violascens]|nr:hypothetical protein GCM10010289_73220 [Streptomyces violascens]
MIGPDRPPGPGSLRVAAPYNRIVQPQLSAVETAGRRCRQCTADTDTTRSETFVASGRAWK